MCILYVRMYLYVRKSMQQIPSLKLNSYSANREISRILWKLKVRHRVHNSPPLIFIMIEINVIHVYLSQLFRIHF